MPVVKARGVGDGDNGHRDSQSDVPERAQRESKLELFEVDPLVDVRGLKRYVL